MARITAILTACCVMATLALAAQEAAAPPRSAPADYVVGPRDVLTITSYDQADLSGKFPVDADGTFTYPFIGRVTAGGTTLRRLEDQLKKRLKDEGYFRNPQLTVVVEEYRSQKVFVVGEVRLPGTYPLSGSMNLVEVLARAGSTLPSAGTEAVVVHGDEAASGPTLPGATSAADIVRIDLHELQNGRLAGNPVLRDGDTVFVPRAENVYVSGQVRNSGAYALQQKNTTVLQALSLAGGMTDRGSDARIKVIRLVDGEKQEIPVKLGDLVQPGDTLIVPQRYF